MAHGLELFSNAGGLVYSSQDVTWNQVDFFPVAANGSEFKNYPVLQGRAVLTVQMFVNPPPNDRKAIAHNVVVSGTSVSVSGGTESAYILVLMR
jgi:hypothetical protein